MFLKACLTALAVSVVGLVSVSFAPAPKFASPVVYVSINPDAHGSGVDIGNGYILTAAHVADDPKIGEKSLDIIDSLKVHHKVSVVWVNHDYDVALLHIDDEAKVASAPLSCRYLDRGEKITMEGYPLGLGDTTTWGQIGDANIASVGPWKAVNVVSGQLVPGMSGGPVWDSHGYVVGINVGLAVEPQRVLSGDPNDPMMPPLVGVAPMGFNLSFIVPGRPICKLLAR